MKLDKLKYAVDRSAGYVLFIFLILSFLSDFIDKIYIYNDIHFIKFNQLLKVLFLIYAIGLSLLYFSYFFKHIRFIYITCAILSLVFLLKGTNYGLYKMEFLRYIILFIAFPVFYHLVSMTNFKTLAALHKLFRYVIAINAILILVGLIFDIHIFKTYKANRFGFNGMLLSQGFTPFLYLCASILFWHLKDKLMLLVTLFIAVLSGIKGVYLAEFMAFALIVVFDKNLGRTFKIRTISIMSLGLVLITIATLSLSPFKEIIKSEGILTAIFSYRLDNLNRLLSTMTAENYNVLIGIIELEKVRLELQIVDILLFFGVIGLIIYLYFIFNLYNMIKRSYLAVILLATALFVSLLIGNLFYIPLSSFIVVITILGLNETYLRSNKPPL